MLTQTFLVFSLLVATIYANPGSCPPATGIGLCVEACSSDEDCEIYQKCCSNGCGHECRTAIDNVSGQCPQPSPNSAGLCVERCSADDDCLSNQKCCSNGCGHECMNV